MRFSLPPNNLLVKCTMFLAILLSSQTFLLAQAPTSLRYPPSNVFTTNVDNVYMAPTVAGNVSSYAITPLANFNLTGLAFNSATGVISGTPTTATPTTTYTVTATNDYGNTSTTFTLQTFNYYYNNSDGKVSFLTSRAVPKVYAGTLANAGRASGDIVLYTNVVTIGGIQIDCIVTSRTVNNITAWDAYDQNAASGTNFSSNDSSYFAPQFTFGTGGGSIIFDFQFILGGSYIDATRKGTNVVLKDVKLNTYDIDGNGTAIQYNEFGGFATSELSSTPVTKQVVSYNPTTGLTRFTSNSSTNTSTVIAPENRIRLSYKEMSDFSIVLGASASGLAYYFLDFSVGGTFTTTSTSPPSIDLNTAVDGVNNGNAGCGSLLDFTGVTQTNVENGTATGVFTELTVSFRTDTIKNGVNEKLILKGATSGGSISLNFANAASIPNVVFSNITYAVAATVAGGISTLKFTRSSGTSTFLIAQAEALLDALQYQNIASFPTSGARPFTVKLRRDSYLSPDAIFTATLNCVSISGNIYHDADGMTNNLVDANSTTGQFAGNEMYALLVNPLNNQVILSQGITAGGAYSFGTATPGNYIVCISSTSKTVGTVVTEATYPSGNYISTGENLGTGVGNDLLVDGKIYITVGSISATNVNFGIQIPPVTTSKALADQPNPGGFNNYVIPNGSFGTSDADGSIASITITEFPTGANYLKIGTTVYTNPVGGSCPPLTTCTAWPGSVTVPYSGNNPAQAISVDPSADVTTSIVIKYKATDNGAAESNSSTLTIPFVVTNYYTISGNVWHDFNGDGNKAPEEPLTNVAADGQVLYALLVQNNNTYSGVPTVFASSIVNSSTGYAFSLVPEGNNYEVRIVSSAIAPVAGSAISNIVPALAPGWTGVSTNSAGTITTGINSNNPIITINNLTSAKTNLNIGIERMAIADVKTYTGVSTAVGGPVSSINITNTNNGSITYQKSLTMSGNLATGSVPGMLSGTDPDGSGSATALTILSGTTGVSLIIDPASYYNMGSVSAFPTMLTYNNIQLQAGGCRGADIGNAVCNSYNAVTGYWEIPDYNGSLLKVLTTTGTTELGFNYAWKDAAGIYGPFSAYRVSFNQALPLNLLSFTAKSEGNKNVQLEWNTANEYNTAYFDIEHSENGNTFAKVGRVNASGEALYSGYRFMHSNVKEGANYYRLAMYDKDGSFVYSAIKPLFINTESTDMITIVPNPVRKMNKLNVYWQGGAGNNTALIIYDATGKANYRGKMDVTGRAVINVGNWSSGIYYLELFNGTVKELRKIVIE